MSTTQLFEDITFTENESYERIISDLITKKYSIVDDFFTLEDVSTLRESLLIKYEEDSFKKSAIGNYTNQEIDKTIRGDFILWIDEKKEEPTVVFC